MARRALSITLEIDNVAWLKGRAGAAGESVSEMIDQLVTAARQGQCAGQRRSVVGTIDVDASDPLLETADAALRAAFDASLERPVAVREARRRIRRGLPHHGSGVADPHSAVTDTHPLIFHAAGGGHLGPRAAAFFERCERRDAILYVPAAVIWECALLARVGRINLRRSVRAFFDDLFSNPAYQPLDLNPEQVFLADDLRFTRDPFDALIVSATQIAGLSLVTRDHAIRESGAVGVIW